MTTNTNGPLIITKKQCKLVVSGRYQCWCYPAVNEPLIWSMCFYLPQSLAMCKHIGSLGIKWALYGSGSACITQYNFLLTPFYSNKLQTSAYTRISICKKRYDICYKTAQHTLAHIDTLMIFSEQGHFFKYICYCLSVLHLKIASELVNKKVMANAQNSTCSLASYNLLTDSNEPSDRNYIFLQIVVSFFYILGSFS